MPPSTSTMKGSLAAAHASAGRAGIRTCTRRPQLLRASMGGQPQVVMGRNAVGASCSSSSKEAIKVAVGNTVVGRRALGLSSAAFLAAKPAWAGKWDADDEDDEDEALASSSSGGGTFYDQWPYSKPGDIVPYIYANAREGDARAVLAAMDAFGEYYPMWKLGPEKGGKLEKLVAKHKPSRCVEIGSFLGYSAISTALNLPSGGTLTCIEGNPEFAAVALKMIEFSGVSSKVKVVVGRSDQMIPGVAQEVGPVDFIFEDHCKDCYLPDLKKMVSLGMVHKGTVVVADNVIKPGAKGWLEYLVPENGWKTELLPASFEYKSFAEGWEQEADALSYSIFTGVVAAAVPEGDEAGGLTAAI